jgi:hypothetical protein
MGTIVAEVVDNGEKRDGRGRRLTAAARRAEVVRAYPGRACRRHHALAPDPSAKCRGPMPTGLALDTYLEALTPCYLIEACASKLRITPWELLILIEIFVA